MHYRVSKRGKHAPWWLYLTIGIIASPFVLVLGWISRFFMGLPVGTPKEAGLQFLAWIGYTICWSAFIIASHRKQGFYLYLPYSYLVLVLATIGIYLLM